MDIGTKINELNYKLMMWKAAGKDKLDPDTYNKIHKEFERLIVMNNNNILTNDKLEDYWNF